MAINNKQLLEKLESNDQTIIEESTPSIENSTPNDLLNEHVNVKNGVAESINQLKSPSSCTIDKSKNEQQINVCTSEIPSPRGTEHEVKVIAKRNDGSKWYLKQTNGSTENQRVPEVKRRISIEPIDSVVPRNSAESIDVSSKNILNICVDSNPNDDIVKGEDIRTGQTINKLIDKPKPLIEIVSDSDEYDLTDVVDLKISNELNPRKDMETSENLIVHHGQIECSTINSIDEAKKQKHLDNLNVDSSFETQQLVTSKSSAITFFCKNLDELKDHDSNNESDSDTISNSNSSLEEI